MKNEREMSFFGAKGIGNDDEGSDEDELMNFTKLYSRSIIVGQKWPWTKLVDIESDRQFYRNEMEDYFQFAAPPEFGGVLKKDKNGQVKGTGASQGGATEGRRRQGMMGGLQETPIADEQPDKLDPSSVVYLRERFNSEITSRRKHFTQQNKIVRELEKGNTDVDVRALSPSRRMKAALTYSRNMRTGAAGTTKGGAGLRKNSVFFRGGNASQSAIEDLLPPEQYRQHDPEDFRRWRDLSDIQNNTLGGLQEEIGWHDCVTLLQRLRRFSDLRTFMDQMNGQVNKRGMMSSGSGFLVKGGIESSSRLRASEGGDVGAGRYRGGRDSGELFLPSARVMCTVFEITLFFGAAESMGGPIDFVCGTTTNFRYVDRKGGGRETLEDLSRMAALKRVTSHHVSQKVSEVSEWGMMDGMGYDGI
jgi:hypothetical protein